MGCGPYTLSRFLKHTEDYVSAFGREAELRERDVVLDVESYNVIRRENSAVRYCFGLFGYIFGQDLPDSIYYHPIMLKMHIAAVDMVCWANVSGLCIGHSVTAHVSSQDLYSYNMEQAMGHFTNNILTVLQKEKSVDLQGAADLVGVHFKELYDEFEADKQRLPSFGEEMDQIVA